MKWSCSVLSPSGGQKVLQHSKEIASLSALLEAMVLPSSSFPVVALFCSPCCWQQQCISARFEHQELIKEVCRCSSSAQQSHLPAQVYVRLSEQCGLGDHLSVLNVMLARIANNMKTFVTSEEVVTRTLELFQVS